MKCYLCGSEIDDSARFCSHCGGDQSKRPPETVSCCHCGKQIKPGARFCVYCGGNQAEPPVEQEPEVILEPAVEEEAPAAEPVLVPEPEVIPEPAPIEPEPAPEPAPEPEPVVIRPPAPEPVYVPAPAPQPIPVPQPAPAQPNWQAAVQQQPVVMVQSMRPAILLPTGRSLGKMFWLGLITGGIYSTVVWSRMVEELNMVASAHDGKRTQQLMWASVLSGLTLGIYYFVWIHGLCNRVGDELRRRNLGYKFSAATFWLWNVLGSLIFVGPFIYLHKLTKAMNLINADYNDKG